MGRKLYTLTEEQLKDIKMWIWKGVRYARISAQFHITKGYISQITTGNAWEEIPWPDGSFGRLPQAQAMKIEQERQKHKGIADRIEAELPSVEGTMSVEDREKFRAEFAAAEAERLRQSDEELKAILQPKKGKARGKKGG
jgi:hypothetical protein|tara:strand:+ start:350 stop:769 length:420 start_codon:yes stop_codon:yes gene_type:complete